MTQLKYEYDEEQNLLRVYGLGEYQLSQPFTKDYNEYLIVPELFLRDDADAIIESLKKQLPNMFAYFDKYLSNFIVDSYRNSSDRSEVVAYRRIMVFQLSAYINSTYIASEALQLPFESVHLNITCI